MDMNVEVDPDWGSSPGAEFATSTTASDRGAASLGFAGTASREEARGAAGLTALASDSFGGDPTLPMIPSTWTPDADHDADPRAEEA